MVGQKSLTQSHSQNPKVSNHMDLTSGIVVYDFEGPWETTYLGRMDQIQLLASMTSIKQVILECSGMESLDTAGALLFHDFLEKLTLRKIPYKISSLSPEMRQVLDLVTRFYHPLPLPIAQESGWQGFLIRVGRQTASQGKEFLDLVTFLGRVICQLGKLITAQKQFKFTSFVSHIEQVGVNALPIVSLLSFLIGVVLAYQGITQLARFGAEIFTVNLLAVGILREVGILMTAIIVAGRSGSAFTAQIGTMVLNEELAALQTMGVDPVDVLVLPRILALLFVLPILALFADIVGLLGGAFMTYVFLDLSFAQFMTQFKSALAPSTFWVGMVKAPFFAFIIGLVGCYEGLCVRSSAQSVGSHTTKSVVKSIFLVIVIDAIFSIIFAQLKI